MLIIVMMMMMMMILEPRLSSDENAKATVYGSGG